MRAIQDMEGVISLRPVIDVDVFLSLNGRFDLRTLARCASLADLRARGSNPARS